MILYDVFLVTNHFVAVAACVGYRFGTALTNAAVARAHVS